MATRSDTGLLLLHGLPEAPATDPFKRLASLQAALTALLPVENVFPYRWQTALELNPIGPALRGTLGRRAAPLLDAELRRLQYEHPDIERWVVGGYSAGGWILYQWLAGWEAEGLVVRPSPAQRNRIVLAFTIGSPYQNVRDFIYLLGKLRRVEPWLLPAIVLAQALRPGSLHVMYSETDTTVWPENAAFPAELVASGAIKQLSLASGDHLELPQAAGVIEHLQTELAALL